MRTICVWIWARVYMCFFNLLRAGFSGLHRCTRTPFMEPFHMWQDQQMTRWHADMVTSLQTHRQITFLKDTLRDAQKGNQMGPGKSCAVFYSPSAIIQLDSLSLLWCVKCCARIYKILRRDRCLSLRNVKSENYLWESVYMVTTREFSILHIKVDVFNIPF